MPSACHCDNVLRAFVCDVLDEALHHPKKQARLRAVQTLGALALAMSNRALAVYAPGDDPHEPEVAPETNLPSDPAPPEATAAPFYPRDTSDHPSCVINEDAHGH